MDKNVQKAVHSLFSGNIVKFQEYVNSAVKTKAFERITDRRKEIAHNLLIKEGNLRQGAEDSNDANVETTETSGNMKFMNFHNVKKTDAAPGRTGTSFQTGLR